MVPAFGYRNITLYFGTVGNPILSSSKSESNSREQLVIFLLRIYLPLQKHLLENVFLNSSDEVILMLILQDHSFCFRVMS